MSRMSRNAITYSQLFAAVGGYWCHDCALDTRAAGEYYIVPHKLWAQAVRAGPSFRARHNVYFLCLACLNRRLGGKLRDTDIRMLSPTWLDEDYRYATPADRRRLRILLQFERRVLGHRLPPDPGSIRQRD